MRTMELSAADKRTFFLMLHPHESQALAEAAGFQPASTDVGDIELLDTISKWSVMGAAGCLDVALVCSEWISQFIVDRNKLDDKYLAQYRVIFYGYSVALLGLLMDKNIIDIVSDPYEVCQQVASSLGIPEELFIAVLDQQYLDQDKEEDDD